MSPEIGGQQALVNAFFSRCDEIVNSISSAYQANASLITQWDAGRRGLLVLAVGSVAENPAYFKGQFIPYDEQIYCCRVMKYSKPVSVVNTSRVDEEGVKEISYLGAPLQTAGGNFGTLCIMEAAPVKDTEKTEITLLKFKTILEDELNNLHKQSVRLEHPGLLMGQNN